MKHTSVYYDVRNITCQFNFKIENLYQNLLKSMLMELHANGIKFGIIKI
jgi:hypothetical protein